RHVRAHRRAPDAADPELCARHQPRQPQVGGGARQRPRAVGLGPHHGRVVRRGASPGLRRGHAGARRGRGAAADEEDAGAARAATGATRRTDARRGIGRHLPAARRVLEPGQRGELQRPRAPPARLGEGAAAGDGAQQPVPRAARAVPDALRSRGRSAEDPRADRGEAGGGDEIGPYNRSLSSVHGSMKRFTQFLFAALLVLSLPVLAADPPTPQVAAKAWLLMDVTSGQTLASQNAAERFEPASLTKLLTAYLVFGALREKRITLDQAVPV